MAIKNVKGARVSPKAKAREVVLDAVANVSFGVDNMTENEVKLTTEQLSKIKARVSKLLTPAGKDEEE